MQFATRDFFWLTIVIGLVIGILIEHADVRALHGSQERAQWWEQAARWMGAKAAQTGEEPYFNELRGVGFREQGDEILKQYESIPGRIGTHPDHESVTGHQDLDRVLLLILVVPIALAIGWLIRRRHHEWGKAYVKSSVRSHRWVAPIALAVLLVVCIGNYVARRPFTSTLGLLGLVSIGCQYLKNPNLTLTPELEQQIDEKYEQPIDIRSLFKLKK